MRLEVLVFDGHSTWYWSASVAEAHEILDSVAPGWREGGAAPDNWRPLLPAGLRYTSHGTESFALKGGRIAALVHMAVPDSWPSNVHAVNLDFVSDQLATLRVRMDGLLLTRDRAIARAVTAEVRRIDIAKACGLAGDGGSVIGRALKNTNTLPHQKDRRALQRAALAP